MLRKLQERIFPFIITITALAVSASAIFYSVYGLSKLFAGASTQVIIMTSTLEIAKLVVASLLYQYWNEINKLLRVYFLISCFILMLITSGGIYGFLSAAYQTTANKSQIAEKELMVIDMKRTRFNESRDETKTEKEIINNTIKELRVSLSNPHQVQYVHKETGQLITTTSSSSRRALQKELATSIEEKNQLNLKLEAVTDSIAKLDIAVIHKESADEAKQELGPLIYISELTGKPMNEIVNWLLLLIVFVFDPLAISLVITANFAFNRLRKPALLEENITESVEREAESVKATTPESNTPPLDIKEEIIEEEPVIQTEVDFVESTINLEDMVTNLEEEEIDPLEEMYKENDINPEDLTFEATVPEGKEFNIPYSIEEKKEENVEKELEKEEEKLKEEEKKLGKTHKKKPPKNHLIGKKINKEEWQRAAKLKADKLKNKKSDDDLTKTY